MEHNPTSRPAPLPVLSNPRYRIGLKLGEGGGGAVYKAWDANLQKAVVIKTLFNAAGSEQERDALKNVKSEHLPQVYDFLTENGQTYTVMEFVEGQSLDRLLERGMRFTQAQAVKWYGQLSSALAVLHRQNVCHRDIKPGNIMLLPSGDVCLIDFNAALVAGNDVQLISRSLGYCSPEQYEIYERYRRGEFSRTSAPIRYGGSSSVQAGALGALGATESVDTEATELANPDTQATESVHRVDTTAIDWKRSDIYSLGATMYHLLSGVRPPREPSQLRPISRVGHFSEGIVYVIEQSMRFSPAERFASVALLADAVRNIHRHDTRWRVSQSKKAAAAIVLPLAFALFAGTALFGRNVMAQEKEERYYAAVYDIENGSHPQGAYDDALAMFWDRIDPYRAMAERLWNDGDLDACREYIEANLGNVAEFQADSEARRAFGDIYYILGNCYYYQPGDPNYETARWNFELADRLARDNPTYCRDYAIALARTGAVEDAESALARARRLGLEEGSLSLLEGEIGFARREYESAAERLALAVELAADDYTRYRACHTSDEIFRLLGQPERSIRLLAAEMGRMPLSRRPEMAERLADAYVRAGDYASATELFGELSESGAPQFHIMQNMAVLLQNGGDLDGAAAMLERMADLFPNDYRVPMRQAYLEAERQAGIENESRDYAAAKRGYDEAARLYGGSARPGEADPEMQQLEGLMEQLRNSGWID